VQTLEVAEVAARSNTGHAEGEGRVKVRLGTRLFFSSRCCGVGAWRCWITPINLGSLLQLCRESS